MRPRTGITLFVLGLIVLAGGWALGPAAQPLERSDVATGRLMFPDLAPKLRDAARVEIEYQGKTLAIGKHGSIWGLPDHGFYPVRQSKLHALLTGLTELRLSEKRTADPAQFARLGVEDAADAKSGSDLVRVSDASGEPIVQLLVGHRRTRTRGELPDSVYVRLPGDDQAWLAEGNLAVDADPQLWLDRDIMSIPPARIASVAVTRGDATLRFGSDGDRLVLTSPAEHPKLEDYKVADVARALDSLTLRDVGISKRLAAPDEPRSVFTTNDGLVITVGVSQTGKEVWAHFTAAGADKAKPEADRLQARLGGWEYQLGSWQEKALAPTLDDLKASAPQPDTSKPETAAPAPRQ